MGGWPGNSGAISGQRRGISPESFIAPCRFGIVAGAPLRFARTGRQEPDFMLAAVRMPGSPVVEQIQLQLQRGRSRFGALLPVFQIHRLRIAAIEQA